MANSPCTTHASHAFKDFADRIATLESSGPGAGGPHTHEIADVEGLQAALDAKGTSSFSGSYPDLTNKPVLFSGSYVDLTNKPVLFSGSYADLTNKPTLFSGAYADLTGKPYLGDAAAKNVGTAAGTVAAGDHTHAGGGSGPAVKSGLVNLGAGATAAVTFTTPFASVPQVVVTSQVSNADTSCTYSAFNVTTGGFSLRGAGNPAGNVAWMATTAGNT
jgi:hypothetical protein